MNTTRIVPCPRCGKEVLWQGNPARPFCSSRCREIDMAAWYTEEYRVPAEGGSEDAQAEDAPEEEDAHESGTMNGAALPNRGGDA